MTRSPEYNWFRRTPKAPFIKPVHHDEVPFDEKLPHEISRIYNRGKDLLRVAHNALGFPDLTKSQHLEYLIVNANDVPVLVLNAYRSRKKRGIPVTFDDYKKLEIDFVPTDTEVGRLLELKVEQEEKDGKPVFTKQGKPIYKLPRASLVIELQDDLGILHTHVEWRTKHMHPYGDRAKSKSSRFPDSVKYVESIVLSKPHRIVASYPDPRHRGRERSVVLDDN